MSQTVSAPATRPQLPWSVHSRGFAHKRRCRALPPPSEAEINRMIADFLRSGGEVKQVAAAFAVPTPNATA